MATLVDQARAAVVALKKSDPAAYGIIGRYIADLKGQNVEALGTGEAFTLKDDSGRVSATRQMVRLSAEDGTLVQPVKGGPWTISAFGFRRLADGTGAVVTNAPTVIVEGVEEHNPYMRRDADGNPVEVCCRAIAFRYTENGRPQVSDRTIVFDLRTYLRADMIGKAKYNKTAFRVAPKGMTPTEKGSWAEYPLDGFVSLFMDCAHEECVKFLGQILNRQKKAMEFAQTFAQRNALKHLFGIDRTPNGGTMAQWDVPCTCFRPENDGVVSFGATQYIENIKTLDALASGRPVALPEAAKHGVLLKQGMDIIAEEADLLDGADVEDAVIAHGEDSEDHQPQVEPLPSERGTIVAETPIIEAPVIEYTADELAVLDRLKVAQESMPEEYAEAACSLEVDVEAITPGTAMNILNEINRMMDEG